MKEQGCTTTPGWDPTLQVSQAAASQPKPLQTVLGPGAPYPKFPRAGTPRYEPPRIELGRGWDPRRAQAWTPHPPAPRAAIGPCPVLPRPPPPPRRPPVISTFGRLMAAAGRLGDTCAGASGAAARNDGVTAVPGAARTAKSRRRGRTPGRSVRGRGRAAIGAPRALRDTESHRGYASALPPTGAPRHTESQATESQARHRIPARARREQLPGSPRPRMSGSGPGRPAEVGPGKGLSAALPGLCIGRLSLFQ